MSRMFVVLMMILFSYCVFAFDIAKDKSIRFDGTPLKNADIHCDNDDDLLPERNDFELIDYSVMSNEQGERFALVTIKNKSSGQRFFDNNDLVALLGNCSRILAHEFEYKLNGGERITKQIYFGFQRYPIVKLLMDR
ncbi:hypothetical protein [Azotobacter chroococcum]|uniref:hypothetical protein n=1 Tax=Azotobacter chroococcum TaxID=353 RepID=UPI0010AEB677|nr:hypothetical protein [Azotobacter chroococcum]TKD45647.1 hypothetical protein FCG41_03725 [Azotobacter chroococcum]